MRVYCLSGNCDNGNEQRHRDSRGTSHFVAIKLYRIGGCELSVERNILISVPDHTPVAVENRAERRGHVYRIENLIHSSCFFARVDSTEIDFNGGRVQAFYCRMIYLSCSSACCRR